MLKPTVGQAVNVQQVLDSYSAELLLMVSKAPGNQKKKSWGDLQCGDRYIIYIYIYYTYDIYIYGGFLKLGTPSHHPF